MTSSSPIEIKHVVQHSHDSGTFLDWSSDTKSEFVTVVTVEGKDDQQKDVSESFVTVLAIGDEQTSELGSEVTSADELLSCHLSTSSSDESRSFTCDDPQDVRPAAPGEEVLVYRLPGERLGFGLKFEGGTKTHECVRRLFIQSCADDSPASRVRCSWGALGEGDEVAEIDGTPVSDMTRLDCVRCLKESQVVIRLRVVHSTLARPLVVSELMKNPPSPPPIPPRKRSLSPPVPKQRQQPPQAEVYLDLLAQEQDELSARSNCESESDDTGSSISTVVYACSEPGSIDVAKVLGPFEQLERELQCQIQNDLLPYEEDTTDGALQPPENFQDFIVPPQPAPRMAPATKFRSGKKRPPPPPPPDTEAPQPPDHVVTADLVLTPPANDFIRTSRPNGFILTPPSSPDDEDDNNNKTSWEDISREELCREVLVPIPEEPPMVEGNEAEPTILVDMADDDEPDNKHITNGAEEQDVLTPCPEIIDKMNDVIITPDETPPPSFSRLPPDGHEFPPSYVEPAESLPPPLTYNVKWRQDEKSQRSVKDKIALFSNETSTLGRFRSTEDVSNSHIILDKNSLNQASHFGTLPRKTSAPTPHVRCQSLLDISQPQRPLSALLEQRRKGISKLRGLVIPEKLENVGPPTVVDLPEIRSRSLIEIQPTIKLRSDTEPQHTLPAPSVVTNNTTIPLLPALPTLPKYSPAFKRKSLSLLHKTSSFPESAVESQSIEEEIANEKSELEKRILKAQSVEAENRKNVLASARSSSGRAPLFQRTVAEDECDKPAQSINIKVAYVEEICEGDDLYPEPPRSLPPQIVAPFPPAPRSLPPQTVEPSPQPRSLPPVDTPCPPVPQSVPPQIQQPSPKPRSPPPQKEDPPKPPRSLPPKIETPYSPPIQVEVLHIEPPSPKPRSPPPVVEEPCVVQTTQLENCIQPAETLPLKPEVSDCKPQDSSPAPPQVEEPVLKPAGPLSPSPPAEAPCPKPPRSLPSKVQEPQPRAQRSLIPLKIESPRPKPPRSLPPPPPTPEKQVPRHDDFQTKIPSTKYLKDLKSELILKQDHRKPQASFRDIADRWQHMADNTSQNTSLQQQSNRRSNSVTDIRRAFEVCPPTYSPSNAVSHARVCSLDSGSGVNEARTLDAIGSVSSLASTTSLISQQELQGLLDEAAEEGGNELQVLVLHRENSDTSSVGLTLAGGADCEARDITVHKVLAGSPAERDGRLQKGDRILSINGRSMKGLTHREALLILKAPRPEVVLVVSRVSSLNIEESNSPVRMLTTAPVPMSNNNDSSEATIVSLMKDGAGLGFSLDGGKDSPLGDRPLTVKKIFTGGAAEKCGQLNVGDQLLAVNDADVTSMSRIEAWSFMKKLPVGPVTILVRRQ